MYKKNKNFNSGLILAILTITTILSVGWYVSKPRSEVSANNANLALPSSQQQEPLISAESLPSTKFQSKTVNEITVELMSTRIIETGIEVQICYTTLDGGDWYTMPGSIFYSTYEIPADEAEFISEQKADEKNTGRRCEAIRYRIDEPNTITTPIKFAVSGFWAVPKELPLCENFQRRVDTNPKANALGLKAKCSYDEQAGISVTLSEQAASVAQDKAQQILDEIVKGEVTGPWEFTITELEK